MNKIVKSGLIAILTVICILQVALLLKYLIEASPGLALGMILMSLTINYRDYSSIDNNIFDSAQ